MAKLTDTVPFDRREWFKQYGRERLQGHRLLEVEDLRVGVTITVVCVQTDDDFKIYQRFFVVNFEEKDGLPVVVSAGQWRWRLADLLRDVNPDPDKGFPRGGPGVAVFLIEEQEGGPL